MAWFQVTYFSQCLSRIVPLNLLIPQSASPEEPCRTLYLLNGFFLNVRKNNKIDILTNLHEQIAFSKYISDVFSEKVIILIRFVCISCVVR